MTNSDKEVSEEGAEIINQMAEDSFLTANQASLLHTANTQDPDKARWFIATIHHHSFTGTGQLSDNDFAKLCLMSVHRYEASLGRRVNAPSSPRIGALFNEFGQMGIDDRGEGRGLLIAIRNYLTRTPEKAGEAFVESIEDMLRKEGQDWSSLQDHVRVFNLRANAEHAYIQAIEDSEGPSALDNVKRSMRNGRSLNDLLF